MAKAFAYRHCSAIARRIFLPIAALALVGCGHPKADLYDPQAARPTEAPTAYDDRPWANVLRTCVRDGLVDYETLKRDASQLDEYLNHVAYVGPTTTPSFFGDPSARMAYLINCYNACVLKAVLSSDIPSTMHDVAMRNLEYDYRFRIDGKILDLAQIRERAVEESKGNARFNFALCSAAKGSPTLSDQPYRGNGLNDRLKELALRSIDNPRMVVVDHERQQLLVGLDIWTNREAFYALFRRETRNTTATMLNCLMHLAGPDRRQFLARASGYRVTLLPFDRALNAWSPQSGG
ncbi:MAG: hypothetical protein DHS20C16_00940 [Phycisphaerae bacterium]|nr:MAG: hypothetical protein DHS20C16_00940 [Phycisphaerae bacterium]